MTSPMVVVFGGTGFLGREIVNAVSQAGLQARIASRRPPQRNPNAANGSISHVTADVRNEQTVTVAVEGATAVVNAVALYVEKGGATFDAVHIEGAERVARCARLAGAKILVHISGLGIDSASPSRFVRARARGEQVVHEAFEQSVVMRPSVMFGRGDRFLTTLEKVTRLPAVPVFCNGETRLQPVHVTDVAAAAARVIQSRSAAERVFELGGAEIYRYRRILQMVMTHLGRNRLLLPLPLAVWKMMAGLFAALPSPPLTRDQVILMENDNVVGGNEPTFSDLGMQPASLASMLAYCLPGRGGPNKNVPGESPYGRT